MFSDNFITENVCPYTAPPFARCHVQMRLGHVGHATHLTRGVAFIGAACDHDLAVLPYNAPHRLAKQKRIELRSSNSEDSDA